MSHTPPTQRRLHDDLLLSLTIAQSIRDGVVIGDYAGRICLVSPAAARLLGLDPDQMLGARLADLPGADLGAPGGGRRQAIALGGRVLEVQWVQVRPNDDGSSWVGSVLIYHDLGPSELPSVPPRRQVLHDLRSCLAALRASIDMLFLEALGPLTSQQRELLSIAQNSSAGAVDLLGQLREQMRADESAEPPASAQRERAAV